MNYLYSLFPPVSSTPIPQIHIIDTVSDPPVTIQYIAGENTVSLATVYPSIKRLLAHPACKHSTVYTDNATYPDIANLLPCQPCEAQFVDMFWRNAATLLDYFADFFANDTPAMHAVWFHLLDMWQETALWMPDRDTMQELNLESQFLKDLDETMILFQRVIFGTATNLAGVSPPFEEIIHHPDGIKDSPAGEYDTGPWISGLKPWQQFLCDGGPGVAPLCAPSPPLSVDTGTSTRDCKAKRTRYIPMPGLALIAKHSSRARRHATSLALLDRDSAPEALSAFDAHSLMFPPKGHSHTHVSATTGRTVSYELVNAAPPVVRYVGLADPSMLAARPTWTLVDECVGVCRGCEGYVARSGVEEGEIEEDEGAFDMWVVREGEGRDKVEEGWGKMFEEWWVDDV